MFQAILVEDTEGGAPKSPSREKMNEERSGVLF